MMFSYRDQRKLRRTANGAWLLGDDYGLAIDQLLQHGCAQLPELKETEKRIEDLEDELEQCPFLEPRGMSHGDFILGYIPNTKREIRISYKSLAAPWLIGGSSGAGKSVAARGWMKQAGLLCKGVWLIDCVKSELAMLAPIFERENCDVSVIDTHNLKINPLQPPKNVSPFTYAANISDALVNSLGLPLVARKVFSQTLHCLYERHGLFENGSLDHCPTLFDVREFVFHSRNFHAQTREAILTALDEILLDLKSSLLYSRGWDIQQLAQQKSILQFNSCLQKGKDLLTSTLFLSEVASRVADNRSNVKPDLAVYFDEGSTLLESSDAAISQYVGLVRGLGISLSLSNQSVVTVSQKVLSNIPNLFLGQCSSFADLNTMGSAMGLDAHQKRYLANSLRPGLFLCRLANGAWRKPFLLQTELIEAAGNNNDIELRISNELASQKVVRAKKYENWVPEWMRKEVIVTNPEPPLLEHSPTNKTTVPESTDFGGLTSDELRLLMAIAENPCEPVSAYPALARMSNSKALRVRHKLVSKNLVREQPTQTSKGRGRPSILLAPSEEAVELLGRLNEQRGQL